MGRVKLKIKRLESNTSRLTTYSKRKNGLIKKADELSVLCDIDVVLLLFSPSGRPVLWKGRNSSIEGIIERFSELTPQERVKRKLEIFDVLKRSYRKSDHEVNVQDFFASSCQTIGDLTIQANLLQTQLSQIQKRLSDWNSLDKIDSFELLEQMQDYIRELLDQIQTQKENIGKQQYLPLRSSNQFQNGMHLPFSLGVEQVQQFSWIQNDDCQHMGSLKEKNMLPSRETEHSASRSFRNCSGHFGPFGKAEIASTGQENGVLSELLRTEALRNELIGLKTETLRNELTKTESLKNELIKKESSKNKLTNNSEIFHILQFQPGMHHPFSVEHPFQHFSWIQNDGSQHIVQPKEPDLFPKRETGLSAGNSFRKCSGQIDTVEKAEIAGIGQENDLLSELLSTESLRNELTKNVFLKNKFLKEDSLINKLSKTEFLTNELTKTERLMNELIKTESLRNELTKADSLGIELMKTESLRSEFIRTESLRNELIEAESLKLQPYEQYSYQHCNFNILPDKKFQPAQQTNLQQSTDDYCDEGNFESPESAYDFTHCNWASTAGPSVIPAFDEQLYSQQHCSTAGLVAEELGP